MLPDTRVFDPSHSKHINCRRVILLIDDLIRFNARPRVRE